MNPTDRSARAKQGNLQSERRRRLPLTSGDRSRGRPRWRASARPRRPVSTGGRGPTTTADQEAPTIARPRPKPRDDRANLPRVNDRIRVREVRLVAADGEQLGIKTSQEALAIARAAGLDLVEVAANASPPVCRIMDWGKHKYEQDQRAKEAKRKQSQVVVKEMKFRPKIDVHDYETKKKHVVRFLEEGSKVKITIMFRGREMSHTELGRRILDQLAEDLEELATPESTPKLDGRNMLMVLAPLSKEPKIQARRGSAKGKGKGKSRRGGPAVDVAANADADVEVEALNAAAEADLLDDTEAEVEAEVAEAEVAEAEVAEAEVGADEDERAEVDAEG